LPKLVKSESLILRRFRHGDSSLIIHVFTREFGRIPFIAKGARSGGKRPPVPLVPIVSLETIWAPSVKSELQLLREWSLIDSFGEIHKDFEKLAWAQAALEILGRVLTGEEEHKRLFDETLRYFSALGTTSNRYENLLHRFKLRTLSETGYQINLEIPDSMKGTGRFVPSEGKIVESSSDSRGIIVHQGTWRILSALAKTDYNEITRLSISKSMSDEIKKVLDAAFYSAYEKWKPLESLAMLHPLNLPNMGKD